MTNPALGCAQNADGTLREARDIVFYNDVDDERPISGPKETSSTLLHPFFTGSAKPAGKIAGARRSLRTSRPSARITDPDNAESSVQAGKRKAPAVPAAPRKAVRLSAASASESDESARDDSDAESDNGAPGVVGDDTEGEDGEGQEVMDLEEYEATKAMADADHAAAIAKAPRTDSTADIRTVFTRIKKYNNPKSGNIEDGSLCKICVDNGGEQTFFKGSVTSLRKHIARQKGHYEIYKARCEKLGIEINNSAIPKSSSSGGVQSTLDGQVVSTPRPPPFTPAGLLDHITQLVVTRDEAFMLVDNPSLRALIKYCRPSITDSDFPTRKQLRAHILALAKKVEMEVRLVYQSIPSVVSTTHDAWTSASRIPFLNVNGHCIVAPVGRPNDWEMRMDELAFMKIEGRHTGENLGNAIFSTLARYDLQGKAGWITSDGASVNRTTARTVERKLTSHDASWKAKEQDMMCMEHAVHTAAKHFVATVAPTPPKTLHKKIQDLLGEACDNGDIDAADVAKVLATLDKGGDDNEDPEAKPADSEWTTGDAVGKILAFIKQVRMSPQAREFFKKCCVQVSVLQLELLLWVRTRWASLYKCLSRVLELRKAIDRFTLIADSSDEVPPLRNKTYGEYRLSPAEWERIVMIHEALREPADVTQTFSKERVPTVWRVIPTLEYLIKRWETMSEHPRYTEISSALTDGTNSLRKWFHRADTTSNVYFICLVLDPNVKDRYFRARWGDEQYKKGMKALEDTFDKYHASAAAAATKAAPQINSVQTAASEATPIRRYGSSYLMDAVNSLQQDDRARADPREELKGYLAAPVEQTDNVLHWWGHCAIHPTLRNMARDYLAIQGSSTSAERAFSSGSLTGTKLRNKLTPEIFEALQLLKSAYRNGHLSASNDAAKHMDALIAELDEHHYGFPELDLEMQDLDGEEYIM